MLIELIDWSHTCDDGCCSSYGVDVIVNGKLVTQHGNDIEEAISSILKNLNVEHKIEYKYD